jgi:hypothetical protein
MKSLWKWIGANDKQLRAVFTVVAAVYVVWQYQTNVRNQRIAQASDYFVLKDRRDQVLEAQYKLEKFLHGKAYQDFSAAMQKVPEDLKEASYKVGLPKLVDDSNEDKDVYTIIRFYGDLDLCVKASNCDPNTVCRYFFQDMQDFRENYRPLFDSSPDSSSAKAMSELTEQECSSDFRNYCSLCNNSSPDCRDVRPRRPFIARLLGG